MCKKRDYINTLVRIYKNVNNLSLILLLIITDEGVSSFTNVSCEQSRRGGQVDRGTGCVLALVSNTGDGSCGLGRGCNEDVSRETSGPTTETLVTGCFCFRRSFLTELVRR